MTNNLAKFFFIAGVIFIIASVFIDRRIKIPVGRLPGDIIIKKGNFVFYFPVATSIIISILLTVIFSLIRKWR